MNHDAKRLTALEAAVHVAGRLGSWTPPPGAQAVPAPLPTVWVARLAAALAALERCGFMVSMRYYRIDRDDKGKELPRVLVRAAAQRREDPRAWFIVAESD